MDTWAVATPTPSLPPLVANLRSVSRGAPERQAAETGGIGKRLAEIRRTFGFEGFRNYEGMAVTLQSDFPEMFFAQTAPVSDNPVNPRRRSYGAQPTMQFGALDLADAAKEFKFMVDEIEESLLGGKAMIKQLKRGEAEEERLKPRTFKHYKVKLPSKPSQVTVKVELISGSTDPELWGSLTHDHPDSLHSEFKGDRNKLVYDHCIPPSKFGEGSDVDRRTAVPPCTDLYITVEGRGTRNRPGDRQEVGVFQISFSVKRIAIVLSRTELQQQGGNVRMGWQARLQQLRNDIPKRDQFDQDLQAYQVHVKLARRIEMGDRDFNAINKQAADKATNYEKLKAVEFKALQRIARQEAAGLRREGKLPSVAISSTEAEDEYIDASVMVKPNTSGSSRKRCLRESEVVHVKAGPAISVIAAMNRAVFCGLNIRKKPEPEAMQRLIG